MSAVVKWQQHKEKEKLEEEESNNLFEMTLTLIKNEKFPLDNTLAQALL
jgi:hypothetical protein